LAFYETINIEKGRFCPLLPSSVIVIRHNHKTGWSISKQVKECNVWGEKEVFSETVRPVWWEDATPGTSRKDCWFLDAA